MPARLAPRYTFVPFTLVHTAKYIKWLPYELLDRAYQRGRSQFATEFFTPIGSRDINVRIHAARFYRFIVLTECETIHEKNRVLLAFGDLSLYRIRILDGPPTSGLRADHPSQIAPL